MSLGPGGRGYMAPEALEAVKAAGIIAGYKMYLDLIDDLLDGKEIIESGMKKEVDRCAAAIDRAVSGATVALVSSGDAGIYGMAGLVFDICRQKGLRAANPDESLNEPAIEPPDLYVRVVPGIPAFNAAASLVGAPLMHDFAAVSLSDHLTPWELIEKRLDAVASADFVIAVYNPRSKSRPDLLEKARDILLRHKSPETPVAIVRRAMREDQWTCLTTLGGLPYDEVDMQSVLLVGNQSTYIWDGKMVTPRGYLNKYTV